jgi:hypothetical protein
LRSSEVLLEKSYATKHSTRTGDKLLEVPKLDASGKDWPAWKARLELSLTARGLSGYLYGTKPMPIDPAEGQSVAWIPTTSLEVAAVRDYEESLEKWVEQDAIVKQQIAVTIPDSLFMLIKSKPTAHDYFNALKDKFKNCSLVVSVEKRRQLGELKLKEGGDVRTHFEKMTALCEELASL